ncbi:MAG: porin [Armatimonadota bacterium]
MRIANLLMAGTLLLPATGALANQKPAGVTSQDWSYQAVEALANRGLVHGYQDGKFLDGKTLTRIEMASLIKRVIDNLMELPSPGDERSLVPETPGTAASRGQGVEPFPLGRPLPAAAGRTAAFQESDLATVRRLADEYSVELAVIGVELQDFNEKLTALEGRLGEVEKIVRDPEGPLQKAIRDITRIDRLRFSGYVQARFDAYQKTREADPEGIRGPVANTFDVRRMRLTARGRPTEKVGFKWELEGGSLEVETRDAFLSYFVTGNPATGHTVNFGQMKIPFGFEIPQSSGARETPERARVIRYFFPSERDQGITVASATGKRWFYELGVFNGVIGPGTAALGLRDNNNDKNIGGRVRTTQLNGKIDGGLSFYLGTSTRTALFLGETPWRPDAPTPQNPVQNKRLTLGADVQWHPRDGTELRAEYLWGKAFGSYASGYILQGIQRIDRRNQFVVRYDWLGIEDTVLAPLGLGGTPVGDSVPYRGTLGNLAVGWIHQLDPAIQLKLFYEINELGREELEYGKVPWLGNLLRFEVLTRF